MAVKLSTDLLKKRGLFFSFRSKPFPALYFHLKRIILELIRKYKRKKMIQTLTPPQNNTSQPIKLGVNLQSDNINTIRQAYKSHKWAFIEHFFDEATHNELCDSFPHELFFNLPVSGYKFYSWSDESKWERDDNRTAFNPSVSKDFFNLYPSYRNLFNFLNSPEMSEKVAKITNSQKTSLYSIALTRATEGSFLSPHMDTIAKEKIEEIRMNFIYFLLAGGSSPVNCGGTGLYADNEFKDPIFIPPVIRNSALLYNSLTPFYHGFDVVAPGSFRWAIVFQFKLI